LLLPWEHCRRRRRRQSINEGDKLFSIPIDLCLTRAASRRVFGKQVIPASMSEYIAIALLLVNERCARAHAH
jgi:hypothetical protein